MQRCSYLVGRRGDDKDILVGPNFSSGVTVQNDLRSSHDRKEYSSPL